MGASWFAKMQKGLRMKHADVFMVQNQARASNLLKTFCVSAAAAKQGGKPRTQEAKLAHAAAKASSRAMPTRFHTNLLMLCFWQERLLSALVEIE